MQHLYLPPPPVTKVLSTDDYVVRHSIFYHGNSERLLTVGHPYFALKDGGKKLDVPKVSPNQYRVFEVVLPNPNKFALADPSIYNPEVSRLVWAVRGLEVSRGQPLGVGLSGNPNFNRLLDVESPSKAQDNGADNDKRVNIAFDVKQSQVLIVGCTPAIGEHWKLAKACGGVPADNCPPLELVKTQIEDGDMGEVGFGAMDFKALQASRSEVPLDLVDTTSKYPDYIQMGQETSGNSMFFFARREQMYTRHFMVRDGLLENEKVPKEMYVARAQDDDKKSHRYQYTHTPSGSLVSTDSQIFNRPYWLQRAQGLNNGVCWHDKLYVTVFDNTRGTNFTISVKKQAAGGDQYDPKNYHVYLRHVEEFELSFIFELCSVPLTPETMAHLHTMDPTILEDWEIGINPPVSSQLETTYRFIASSATRCNRPPAPPLEPSKGTFWTIDLQERLSLDLDQFTLGRRFIVQGGLSRSRVARKRRASTSSAKTKAKRPAKKRRT